MVKRRFKKTKFRTKDTRELFCIYEPTIKIKGSVLISDNFRRKKRESLGSLDAPFVARARKDKC